MLSGLVVAPVWSTFVRRTHKDIHLEPWQRQRAVLLAPVVMMANPTISTVETECWNQLVINIHIKSVAITEASAFDKLQSALGSWCGRFHDDGIPP